MTKIVTFPSEKAKIVREACEWIARMDHKNFSKKDRIELNEWVNKSDLHRAELERLAQFWDQISDVDFDDKEVGYPEISQDNYNQYNNHWAEKKGYKYIIYTAASLLLIASISVILHFNNINEFQSTNGKYTTNVGDQETIILSDGSKIRLNTDTFVEVNYSPGERNIHLYKGEAYFDVAHNPEVPFTVKARKGDVRALGTIFSVRVKDDLVNVLVEEGRVRIRANDEVDLLNTPQIEEQKEVLKTENLKKSAVVTVDAGNNVIFGEQTIESVVLEEKEAIERKFSWQKGILAFDDEPLSDVIEEVSRYTSYQIIIADPNIRTLRVGGYYPIGKIQAIFNALELNLGLEINKVDEQTYYITRKSV